MRADKLVGRYVYDSKINPKYFNEYFQKPLIEEVTLFMASSSLLIIYHIFRQKKLIMQDHRNGSAFLFQNM